jgi:hypothetical protein
MKIIVKACIALFTCSVVAAEALDLDTTVLQPCPKALEESEANQPAEDAQWSLTLSPYTHHWKVSDEHKHVHLGSLERNLSGGRFCGLALFNNSFGQPSAYLYAGKQWNGFAGEPNIFVKVSAGFIYGYKGDHKDVLYYNHSGFAPVVIPAIGYEFTKKDSANVTILGTAGVLFAYGHKF